MHPFPPALVLLGALSSSLPAQTPAPPAPVELKGFAATLERLSQRGTFNGVALVAQGDRILIQKAQGLADLAHGEPNGPGTKFNLASVGKLFTAVSILQLVQAGQISLEAPVGRYLPDYPNSAVRDSVTVRHLLNHASGLDDFFTEAFEAASKDRFRNPSDFLPLFAGKPLLFTPGTDDRYSNAGFLVLGLIVERVSGASYFDYVAKHIFEPAGMTGAGFDEADLPSPHLATGYFPAKGRPGRWQSNLFQHVVKGGPAGGGYATAADMLHFIRALVGGKLLDAAHTRLALTPSEDRRGASYGVVRVKDRTIYGHSGGFAGIGASVNHGLESGLTVILFSNQDRADWALLEAAAQRLLVGELPHHAALDFTRKVADLAPAAGAEAASAHLRAHPEGQLMAPFLKDLVDEAVWEGREPYASALKRLLPSAP